MSLVRRDTSFSPMRSAGRPYVDQVVSEFNALPVEAASHPHYAEARKIVEDRDVIDWQQLFTLELWVLQMLPLHQLEARAARLAANGEPSSSSRPSIGEDEYESKLRGWALNRLSEHHWALRKLLLQEQEGWRLRRQLNEALLVVSVAALVIGVCAALLGSAGVAILAVDAWLGVVGAYTSIMWRARKLGLHKQMKKGAHISYSELCALDVSRDSITQGMLLGGLFGVIGHFLLGSGLIQVVVSAQVSTALVPQFGTPVDLAEPGYMAWLAPARAADFAKLAIWCFLFGFAERFIPDALDRLSDKAQESNQAKVESRRRAG